MASGITGYNWAQRTGRTGLANNIMVRYNRDRNVPYRPSPTSYRIAARSRMRSARSRTFTLRRKNKGTSGIGVTTQHDARLVYRKSRMPRRRRFAWKKFKNKVLSISEKDLGTQTTVFNHLVGPVNTNSTDQLNWCCALYSQLSSDVLFNDMATIGSLNGAADTTAAKGLKVDHSSKVLFQSGVLDITIKNASTFNNGTSTGPDSRARMEIDVYEMTCRLSDENGATYNNILSLLAQNSTRTEPIGGSGTEVILPLRGVTPFDLTYALSRFGIKIWKKTKYQIANGDQFTYQVRDPRRHVMSQRDLTSTEGFGNRYTRYIVVVGRLSPGLTIGVAANTFQETLNIGVTRKYMYKIENWTDDRTNYIT